MTTFWRQVWIFGCVLLLGLAGCGNDDNDSGSNSGGGGGFASGYTLSGVIRVPENSAGDSDVNNSAASYRFNSTLDTAQSIPNPVMLGGYVNRPYQGDNGRSYVGGDPDDYFWVDLKAGQVLQLFVASDNLVRDDLDLYLIDSDGFTVDGSESRGTTELLLVPESARYYVRIHAYAGASNYTLSIGQVTGFAVQNQSMRISDDFAPGQVTVSLAQHAGFTSQAAVGASFSALGLNPKAGEPDRRMLLELDGNGGYRTLSADDLNLQFRDATRRLKHETLQAVKRLQQRPDVVAASPNYRFAAFRVPNDTRYPYQWHYHMLNLPQAWDITQGSSDVVVAVIDTGVLSDHPDLRGKLVDVYDFISDSSISVDGDGIDGNAEDPGDNRSGGSSFHGTHVAGTVGAITDNAKGIAGSGWNTRVMPLRVLGQGGAGYDYDIEQAIRYALGLSNDSRRTPSRTADIINLSLGGPTISSSFRNLMQDAYNRGVFVVAAAGNEGSGAPSYPAALDTVISVSAVDISRRHASYSNYGSTIDIAAPGGDDTPDVDGDGWPDKILSTIGDDSRGSVLYLYADMMGTSMAAPHVAGVIALMKAVNPSLTPVDFDNLLHGGQITTDLGSTGHDQHFGYGLLDAYRAVLAAAGGTATDPGMPQPPVIEEFPPQLNVSPTSLNFGINSTELPLAVRNVGGGSLQILGIGQNSGGYLDLIPSEVDGNGVGTYTATLNRGSLGPGTYAAAYRFESNGGTVDIPVLWQVGVSGATGDAGYQYILLVDAATEGTIQEYKAANRNGFYSFSFSGVAPGTYKVVSGSDNNNDFIICDPGESCGAYTTLDQPITLTVDRSMSGIDFTVSFSGNFLGALSADKPAALPGRKGYQRLPLRKVR